jgi:hypothetical protein
MTLTVNDTILDEEFRATQTGTGDDNDVSTLSAGVQAAIDAVSDSADFYSSPTGFPQFAENSNFYSSDQAVTDLFLASNGSGDPWPAAGVATDLYVGSDQVYLFASSDDNIVFGRVGGATGDIVLVIAVDETKDAGVVTAANLWTGIYAPLVHDGQNAVDSADELNLDNLIYLGSDFDTTTEVPFENFASVPSGQDAFALVGPTSGSSSVDLLLTGFAGSTAGTVNVSTQGLGSNAQHVDEGESIRIDIVSANATNFANADTASEVHNAANLGYAGGHQDAVAATFEIEQINPTGVVATCSVFAYHTASNVQGAGFNANAISSPGTAVAIDVEDVIILNAAGDDITDDFLTRGGTIVADGQGVKVSGLLIHEQVHFTTDGDAFNRFVVTNSDATKGPDTFDVGGIKVTVLQGGNGTEYADLGEHLIYQDDGPSIAPSGTAAPTLTVSDVLLGDLGKDTDGFAGLFTPDYGADGSGSISYDVGTPLGGVDSGLVDTLTGNSIFLFLEGNTDTAYVGDHKVVGREGTDATDAETGAIAFFISADPGTGEVTLQQDRAVFHDKNTHDTSVSFATADLVTLTATISDSETNADTDSASVDIGLSFSIQDDVPLIDDTTVENLLVDNTVPSDSDSSDFDFDSGNDTPADVTIVGAPDTLGFSFIFDAEHDSITGSLNGHELYTLSVDDNGGYVFTLTGELPSSTLNLNTAEIKAGGPDTNSIEVGAIENDSFVRISGDSSVGAGNINESHAFVGVDNGNLDAGESLTFALYNPDSADPGIDPDQIFFEGIRIGTKSAGASMYHWEADLVGGGTASGDLSVGKNGTLLIDPTGDVLIESITVTKLTGSATKIGLGDIDILLPPGDYKLGFDVQATDADGDYDQTSFFVQIDGNGDGFITSPTII